MGGHLGLRLAASSETGGGALEEPRRNAVTEASPHHREGDARGRGACRLGRAFAGAPGRSRADQRSI